MRCELSTHSLLLNVVSMMLGMVTAAAAAAATGRWIPFDFLAVYYRCLRRAPERSENSQH